MGRYYRGDIEGKFAFAVQSSNDASFFGIDECEPHYIEYYADEDHMKGIDEGLKECVRQMKGNYKKIKKFFKLGGGYNNEILSEAIGVEVEEVKELLEWYFRYELGKQILDCVKKNGYCSFEAEL